MREESANASPDAVIARIGARQHGVVSLRQLKRVGVSRQSLVGHPGLSEGGRLKLLGYDLVRFTWRQLAADAVATAATLRALLAAQRK